VQPKADRGSRFGRQATPLYIGLPSTMLITDVVGVTEMSWNPDCAKSRLYSFSVRSIPPGSTSIAISKSLAKEGSFPVGHDSFKDKEPSVFWNYFSTLFQDLDRLRVGPIVYNMAKQIGVCTGRQRLKKISFYEGASI
jgi:hypothetical protein